jgi:hypothetical protein
MMRVIGIASVIAIALATVGAPAHAEAASGEHAVVSGSGRLGTAPFSGLESATFQLSAHATHNGVSGFAAFTFVPKPGLSYDASLDVTVDIDCLEVQPVVGVTGVVLAGSVRRVDPMPNVYPNVVPGARMFFTAVDGGSPSLGTVDAFYWSPGDEHPDECNEEGSFANWSPNWADVSQGNIVIRAGGGPVA